MDAPALQQSPALPASIVVDVFRSDDGTNPAGGTARTVHRDHCSARPLLRRAARRRALEAEVLALKDVQLPMRAGNS